MYLAGTTPLSLRTPITSAARLLLSSRAVCADADWVCTPMTMVSWLMATSRPRRAGGAISEMYIGEILEARPMLMPPRMRQVTNAGKLCANAIPMEERTKFAAANISIGLRPKRSLSAPEASAPARHPSSAQLCAQPVGEMALALSLFQSPASAATVRAVSLRWKNAS